MISDPVRHGLRRKLLAVLVAACYGSAYANPGAPQVVAGQASFLQQGNLYSITNTPNTIINWQNFSISPNEITRFIQQSGDSKVLNRIVGQDPSKILGSLQSNGKVYLINPNGVLFGKDARVDVNGLVASSLALSNADFLAGKHHFAGEGAGKIVNQGSITTPDGGQVYLIASSVENSGVITSPQGEVVLAAGRSVQLVDSANPDVHVVVSAPSDQALNLGQVLAAGGKVGIYGALVNQRGRVSADSAAMGANGKIVLKSSGTTLLEAGSRTSAVNAAGKGGEIQLLGDRVGLTDDAAVDASGAAGGGAVLIGGDYQGKNAAVPHAQQTYIGQQVTVRADATQQGDGGKVVAWSDGATRVYGSLSARGGAQGGNGGMLETSGKYLDMQGTADTRAPKGKTGSLLLDPSDIYIASSLGVANEAGMVGSHALSSNGGVFLETGVVQSSLVLTATLQTALGTTDVTVTTANPDGPNGGFIKVLSPIVWTSDKSLTLRADTSIYLNAAITGTSAALNLNAVGGSIVQTTSPVDALQVASLGAIASSSITMHNGSNQITGAATLSTTSGDAVLTGTSLNLGASNVSGSLTASATAGDIHTSGLVHAGGILTAAASGNVTLSNASSGGALSAAAAAGNVTLDGPVSSGGALAAAASGNVTFSGSVSSGGALTAAAATGDVTLGGTVSSGAALTAAAAAGDIVVSGTVSGTGSATLTLTSAVADGTITFDSGAALSSASGNIALKADRMALGGTLTGIHEIRLTPYSAATNIALGGSSADANGVLGLSAADLAGIHLPNNGLLTIGAFGSGTGSLTVAGALDLATSQNHGGLLLQTQTGALTIANGAALGATGVISLQTVPSGASTITNNGAVTSAASINLFSGKMALAGGTLTAPSVSLESSNPINLGAAAPINDTLTLSTTDLASVHATTLNVSVNSSHIGTGDIVVSAPLSVTGSLSLYAQNDIDLQSSVATTGGLKLETTNDISAAGAVSVGGSFVLVGGDWSQSSGTLPAFSAADFQLSGGSFLRVKGGNGSSDTPYTIADIYGLQGINSLLGERNYHSFVLDGDIDASGTSGWNSGAGFVPIGNSDYAYHGVFDGDGHTITGLTINRPTSNNVGLFAYLGSGTIKDLTLAGGSIRGRDQVGGVVGRANSGDINNVHSSANVTGVTNVGGLVGISTASIVGASSSGIVTGLPEAAGSDGAADVGGLVGNNTGSIYGSRSSATVNSTGIGNVGGLVGHNTGDTSQGSISHSYATGSVTASGEKVGGLVGANDGGSIQTSYATGNVVGGGNVGGLVGRNEDDSGYGYFTGTISGAYATGNVSAHTDGTGSLTNMGGLVGEFHEGSISNVYSSGVVSGTGFTSGVKGMVGGTSDYEVTHGYFDSTRAGTSSDAAGGTGLTTTQMMLQDSFGGFSFGGTPQWRIYEGHTTPLLKDMLTSLTVTVAGSGVTKVYDRNSASFAGSATEYSGFTDGDTAVSGALGWGGAKNVGSYAIGGLYSTKYDITYLGSNPLLVITPAQLIAQLSGSKVYNGDTSLSGATVGLTGILAGDTVAITGTVTFADRNAGTGKSLIGTLGLSGADAGNYQFSTSGTGTITKAPLAVTGIVGTNRTYNGNVDALVTGTPSVTAIGSDVVSASVATGHTFVDRHVGEGKSITAQLTLSGEHAGNYQAYTTTTGNIMKAPLTITGLVGVNRVYDASTVAMLTGGTLNDVYSGDTVQVGTVQGQFSGANAKNVGSNKPISLSEATYTLTGTDSGNYFVSSASGTLTANVTQRALTVNGISAQNRAYNGNISAALITEGGNVSGVLGSDSVSLNSSGASGVFADPNVGAGKLVTVSGLELAGADKGNYTFTAPTVNANITQLTKAVWTGSAGDNLWSSSGNWASGAVPTLSNVLNAELGAYGGEVTFDMGTTTLNSLTSVHGQNLKQTGGTLALNHLNTGMNLNLAGGTMTLGIQEGGSLSLQGGDFSVSNGTLNLLGTLSMGDYLQSGGAVSSNSSLNTSSFGMSGGTLNLAGGLTTSAFSMSNGTLSVAGGLTTSTFNMSNGTLSAAGTLAASNFNLSGGAISGMQALTINSQYTQSGGTIVMPGTATINHNNGNLLTVGPITATAGIALNVGEGASIAQSGALNTDHLMVSAQGGVTLNNSANHVLHFSGSNSGSGGISLHNTLSGDDELGVGNLSTSGGSIVIDNVGGIYTEGPLSAANGAVSLTAHSPITINSAVNANSVSLSASTGITLSGSASIVAVNSIAMTAGNGIQLAGLLQSTSGGISLLTQTGNIVADSGMSITGAGPVTLSAAQGTINAPQNIFQGGSTPVLTDAVAAAAAAAAKAAADAAAAKAAADAAAAKAAADAAAAKAAADAAAAKAAADAAAKAASDAAAKAAADAAAKAAEEAAAKAAADAQAKAAADAAAKAAADAAAEAAAKAAADAAAKAAADAAAKAASDAAAKAAADAAAEAAAKAAAEAAAKAAQDAAAKAAADAAAQAAAEAAAKAAQDAALKAAADAAAKASADAAAKAAADAAAKASADAAAKAAADAAAKAAAAKAAADAAAKEAADKAAADASQNQPNQPVSQALNSTVNIINTGASATKEGSAVPVVAVKPATVPAEAEEAKAVEKQEEKKDGIASKDVELKKNEPVKKLYCN